MTIAFQLTRVVAVEFDSLALFDAIDREFRPTASTEPPLSHLLPLAEGLPALRYALQGGDRDRVTVTREGLFGLRVEDRKRSAAYLFSPRPPY